MRLDRLSRRRSLTNAAVSSFAIVVVLWAAPDAWCQNPDEKDKQEATTKQRDTIEPETKKEPVVKQEAGLFDGLKGTVEIGAQTLNVEGDRQGKFQEFRDFPNGLFVRNVHFKFSSVDSPFFLDFKGLEIREQDQRFSAEAGVVGKYRAQFLWDQIPRFYSDGHSLHVSTAPGVLAVSPILRARLQSVPDAGVPASQLGPELPTLLGHEVEIAPVVALRVRWDQLLLTQSYHPNENWELNFRAQRLRLNGTRPRGTGTFAREGNGPGGDGVWEAMGVELPEPVNYRTTNLSFGIRYSRAKWRVGLGYDLSLFRNSIPALTWENPLRVTDALANPPAFGVGRNRLVQAQLALPPHNDYESFPIYASVDLPYQTQLRGAFTWGRGTQDEEFLPYTLNSAMTTDNLAANVPALFGLALPQPSLKGVVNTVNQDYALVSKPWKAMRFLLQYRSNDRDNHSSNIQFPGLSSFGDSSVRNSVDFYGLAIENFPTSYTRQNTTATWRWELRKNLTWELEDDWEVWDRKFRDANRTNEHSFTGRLDYKPFRGVSLKTDYLYANRKPRLYLTQPMTFDPILNGGSWIVTPTTQFIRGVPLEFRQLRRFDEDKRIRNDGGISLEVIRSNRVSFSGSYRYMRDDYDKNFYGLQYDVQSTMDAQVSYFPQESTSFYANYSREQDRTGYRSLGRLQVGGVQNVTACYAQYPIANTWDRSSRIHLDMLQFGINTASAGSRTVLDVSGGVGFARDKTNTVNPFIILANSPHTAGAVNYPDVINWQQEFNVSITHRLRERLDLGVRYRFEPFRLDDYYTTNLQPYSPTQLADGGLPVNTPRQVLLDARFTSYHANVATVFLRYSF
jgi:MtrB/PioB family decaheme-associated outer membrane protein